MQNCFDQIDDYLMGRLSAASQKEFEEQMSSDSLLKGQVEMKELIVKNIQKARASELKTMLSNVPIAVGLGVLLKLFSSVKALLVITVITTAVVTIYYHKKKPQGEASGALKDPSSQPTTSDSVIIAPASVVPHQSEIQKSKKKKVPTATLR